MARELTGVVLKEKWRIDALLGEGGVAAVYAATHRNGKRVAVKVLHPQFATMLDVRDRFLREGYLANRIEHPGAVGVIDDDVTDDGLVFLVMDLLSGESLEKRLYREGRLPVADVLRITDALLDVLAAAHAKGIVHRDVKPENVFLLRDGGQRLLDFGIARLHEQTASRNATQAGAAMGTPSYMPPEQARGRWEMVDARSDLWAVGATMFTLLAGRCVHDAETLNEILLLAMAQPAPPLATVLPGAPPAVAAIVDRALAYEMKDRWPDAATMRSAVQEAMRDPALPPKVTGPFALAPTVGIAPEMTPTGSRGTVMTGSVSDVHPGRSGRAASAPGRTIAAAAVGVVAVVGIAVAAVLAHGRREPSHAAQAPPSASTVLAPAEPPVIDVAALPAAPVEATSAPGPARSTRADPNENVGPVPAAPASTTTAPARGTAATAPPPAAPAPRRAPVPSSNPLDRRY
jgi:serine/threonine-protein kinase